MDWLREGEEWSKLKRLREVRYQKLVTKNRRTIKLVYPSTDNEIVTWKHEKPASKSQKLKAR